MNLSYEKTVALLQTHDTSVVSLYLIRKRKEGNHCKFLECVTQGAARSFVISVPDKFSLVVPAGCTTPESFISPVGAEIGGRQLEYLRKPRGTIESDLFSVSSGFVCHLAGEDVSCYRIVGEADSPYEEAQPDTQIQSLVQNVDTLAVETKKGGGEGETDLSLSGDDGRTRLGPSSLPKLDLLAVRPSSFLFDEIEMGLVYVAVEIYSFYKNRKEIVEELGRNYAFLGDNELDIRQEKIDGLAQRFRLLSAEFASVDDILLQRDSRSKEKLATLKTLLERLLVLEKAAVEPSPKVSSLKSQVQDSIREEHVKSLRFKDSVHDALELCDLFASQILEKIMGLKEEAQKIGAEDAVLET